MDSNLSSERLYDDANRVFTRLSKHRADVEQTSSKHRAGSSIVTYSSKRQANVEQTSSN